MTIPKDVLRFEVLLYLSLLLDALTAAFFGISSEGASEAAHAFVSVVTAVLIAALAVLVWLAARWRKNWARWTLFALFALTLMSYAASFSDLTFSLKTLMDLVSLALSVFGFYFSFTAEARQWFRS